MKSKCEECLGCNRLDDESFKETEDCKYYIKANKKIKRRKEELNMNKKNIKVSAGVILLLFLIIGLSSVTAVPTGYVGVKTRFGKVQDTVIQEGLNAKIPFIEKIVKMNCKTQKIEMSTEASTKDLQTANVSIAVNFNVTQETANKLYKEVGEQYADVIIQPAMLEAIKSSMAQFTAEELLTRRDEVSLKIQETLVNKVEKRGISISEFNTTNINFSDEFNKAIEAKAVKQQEVETAKAELEKQKIQNEKEISVAEKDAKVMELQNAQITENTLRLKALEVQQSLINKWNGSMPTTMLNDNISGLFNIGE